MSFFLPLCAFLVDYVFNYREQCFNHKDKGAADTMSSEPQSNSREFFASCSKTEEIMLSDTLAKGLQEYSIGEKLHALRLRKKMGLVELGGHTGLSAAMLSKVERGKLFPTLPTLLRIAMVFSVGLEYFFSDDRKRHPISIVRRAERKRFPERPDGRDISFHFESLDFTAVERKLSAYHAEFEPLPPGKARVHHHAGVEFLSVLRGKLELRIGNEDHTLESGDSIYFDSSLPHSYRRTSQKPCTAIVVTVP
jgi:transcriptional regulator with XRE-family HTH domain